MADELTEQTKYEILYDHYKDTFEHTKSYASQRDRLFFLVLVVVTFLLFQIVAPGESGLVLSEYATAQLGLQTAIDDSIVTSLLWFSLLALVVRYFQRVITVERQYEYLHQLEDELSRYFSGTVFTREGMTYLSSYKTFSDWSWRLYAIAFPLLLLFVTGTKIIGEVRIYAGTPITFLLDVMAFLGIVLFTVLYVASVHFRDEESIVDKEQKHDAKDNKLSADSTD